MGFNVVCSIALIFTGGAVEIYSLSNVGYLASFIPVLVGYYLLRKYRPDMKPPGAPAGVLQVHRPGDGGRLLRHLDLRRASSTRAFPNALARRRQHAHLLLHRLGDPALLPAALLVPRQGRGSQARRRRRGRRRRRWPPATDHGIAGGSGVPPGIAPTRSRHPAHRAAGGRVRGAADRTGRCSSRRSSSPGRRRRRCSSISIARVWGTSLGFPNPGLNPTRREWDAQRLLVREAVEALEKAGFEASGHVDRHPPGGQADRARGGPLRRRRDRDGRRPRPRRSSATSCGRRSPTGSRAGRGCRCTSSRSEPRGRAAAPAR